MVYTWCIVISRLIFLRHSNLKRIIDNVAIEILSMYCLIVKVDFVLLVTDVVLAK